MININTLLAGLGNTLNTDLYPYFINFKAFSIFAFIYPLPITHLVAENYDPAIKLSF